MAWRLFGAKPFSWTNAGISYIGSLSTSFRKILIEIHESLFKERHLKMTTLSRLQWVNHWWLVESLCKYPERNSSCHGTTSGHAGELGAWGECLCLWPDHHNNTYYAYGWHFFMFSCGLVHGLLCLLHWNLGQSCGCPDASEATLHDIHHEDTGRYFKQIFHGIYCAHTFSAIPDN